MDTSNKVIIDWVSLTSPYTDTAGIIEILGMCDCNFADTYGMHGYRYRKTFEGVNIHYGGNEEKNPGVWLEMSGQGCRTFETYGNGDFRILFEMCLAEPKNHLTRLDVACDLFDKSLDLNTLIDYAQQGSVVTKFRTGNVDLGILGNDGKCLVFGSRSSELLLRIYDKKAERKREDLDSWTRLELQMRDKQALSFILNLKHETLDKTITTNYFNLLNSYIRFVEPGTDSNKSRWKTCQWWLDFIKSSEDYELIKPGSEYNLLALRNYAVRQSGQAVKSYISLVGLNQYIKDLNDEMFTPNKKYVALGVNVNEKIGYDDAVLHQSNFKD